MTLNEMKKSDKVLLTPDEAAEVLGVSAQSIRNQASVAPQHLGFSAMRVGTVTKIPRIPLLKWLGQME